MLTVAGRSDRKTITEHRQPADRLRFSRLVLQDIPMFSELAVLKTHDIGSDPGCRTALAGEASVRNDIVAFGHDKLVLVTQRVGQRADEVEQALAASRDVRAVLNIAIRPKSLGGGGG